MATIRELEDAVRELDPQELAKFRDWFVQFDAAAWDQQFEQDVAAGRLDKFGEEALNDIRNGRCKAL